jgi:hypothetical protein
MAKSCRVRRQNKKATGERTFPAAFNKKSVRFYVMPSDWSVG